MTVLEVLRVMGRGASAQFRFGNRKPGSTTPLLFELGDKHLKDCERMYVPLFLFYRLNIKRVKSLNIYGKKKIFYNLFAQSLIRIFVLTYTIYQWILSNIFLRKCM